MALYAYPQVMYRSDGYTFTCNSDNDVANLPTPAGTAWSSTPWSPANLSASTLQADASADATLQAEVTALQAQLATDQAVISQAGN